MFFFSNIECIFTTIERCSLIQNADRFTKGMTRKLHNMRKGQQWISFHKIVSIKTYCLEFSSSTISCQKEPFWSVLNIIVTSYANLLEARTSHESMATILPRLAWSLEECRFVGWDLSSSNPYSNNQHDHYLSTSYNPANGLRIRWKNQGCWY